MLRKEDVDYQEHVEYQELRDVRARSVKNKRTNAKKLESFLYYTYTCMCVCVYVCQRKRKVAREQREERADEIEATTLAIDASLLSRGNLSWPVARTYLPARSRNYRRQDRNSGKQRLLPGISGRLPLLLLPLPVLLPLLLPLLLLLLLPFDAASEYHE